MDFIDIIILVLIMGGSIVSSVIKSGKNKKNPKGSKSSIPEIEQDFDEESPWESIKRHIEREFTLDENANRPVVQEVVSKDSAASSVDIIEDSSAFSYDKASISDIKSRREEYDRASRMIKAGIYDIPKKSGVGAKNDLTQNEINESNEIIGDFDIRTAVLYSEILKPKFKEY